MTWNELIFELQQIPEDRREEKAVFFDLSSEEGYTIDAKEEMSLDDGDFDSNMGNDTTNTTWVITG
jgi:hypothetical protein